MTVINFHITVFGKKRLKQIHICLAVLLLICTKALSQYPDLGSWNLVNVKYTVNDKWSVFGEIQLRSLKFFDDFHYYEYKGGANYKVHPNLQLTLGAGHYKTFKEGGNFVKPINNNEFRIWPQITINHNLWDLKIEQRYRAEMRFTSNGYRNRFRYRLGLSYPFGNDKKGYKPFQLNGSNELFFTDKEPYFERNRLLFSLNYKTSRAASLQLGYLHQFDYRINDETGRDFLMVGIFIELSRKKASTMKSNFEIKGD